MSANRAVTHCLLLLLFIYGCAEVNVVHPKRRNIVSAVYASGEIVPENEHWLSSARSGILLKKYVREGDTIKRGTLLYVIGDETSQKSLDAAVANDNLSAYNLSSNSPIISELRLGVTNATVKLLNDSANFMRWKNLWNHQIGTKNNLDNAYTQYSISENEKKSAEQRFAMKLNELRLAKKAAETQLAEARKRYSDGYIFSDLDGVVYETQKEEGELVSVNEKLLLLGDAADRTIKLFVDQQDIARIKPGQKVLLQADATGSTVFEATVSFIFPSMNKSDQTFEIEAKFDSRLPYAFIHSPVEANIIVEQKNDALVLPRDVLAGKDSIWIQVNKNQRKIAIRTGIMSFDDIEVISGVDENTAVLVDGYKRN